MSAQSSKKKGRNRRKSREMTINQLRTITYISTLMFAGFLAEKNVDIVIIYGFLGMAIGAIYGKYFNNK